jgi:murein DD-endopeptidase
VTLTKSGEGSYTGSLNSVDQGATLPIEVATLDGAKVHFEVKRVGGVYDGTLNADGSNIAGTWTQTRTPAQPLAFQRGPLPAPTGPLPKPLTPPLDVVVPLAPTAFHADGKTHLVYELHVTNLSPTDCTLTHVEVLNAEAPRATLAHWDGAGMEAIISRPGQPGVAEKAKIGPGLAAVLFLWVTVDPSAKVPTNLMHRLRMKVGTDELTLEAIPVVVNHVPTVAIGPPLSGGEWRAANGPSNTSAHRRALIPIDGHAAIAQRFAIDWVQLYPDGKTYQGDPKDNRHYRAYGAEVHSVADGVVTAMKDGIPQNTPGDPNHAVPITLETVGGNHVIVDLGHGQFAFYAHLQPGSIKVKVGDHVQRGQVLGLLGNSGNSSEPHLHFHLGNANSPLGAEGLPYAFSSYEVQGQSADEKAGPPVKHERELPLEGEIIRFPAP